MDELGIICRYGFKTIEYKKFSSTIIIFSYILTFFMNHKIFYSLVIIQVLSFHDDIKIFAKSLKNLKTLIQIIRIYSQDIRMVFSFRKCVMMIKKMCKKGNKTKNRTTKSGKRNLQFWEILEVDTMKQR